jgi:integrase
VDRRVNGTGSVDEPRPGRFRARLRFTDGSRETVGVFDKPEDAQHALECARAAAAAVGTASTGAMTLRGWGAKWLDARETDGAHRNLTSERSLWRLHVMTAPFADLPLADITRAAVLDWLDALARRRAVVLAPKREGDKAARRVRTRRTLSRQVRVHALNLLRKCLADAADRGHLALNVARDVRVPKNASADDGWTYLTPEEIAIATRSAKIPEAARLLYTFAIYTGMREGELWGLHWADVRGLDPAKGHRPEVTIRYSHRGPTKGGKVRAIPLLEPARAALARWKEIATATPEGLVFPTETGCRRQKSDDAGWGTRKVRGKPRVGHKDLAGIARRVRFHDLRHTCASHLVMGTWGAPWSIAEVCAYLRHSSITVTQRYAHLSPEHLHNKAALTRGSEHSTPPASNAVGSRAGHGGGESGAPAAEKPRDSAGMPGGTRTPDPRLRSPHVSVEMAEGYALGDPTVTRAVARAVVEVGTATGSVPRTLVDALVSAVLSGPAVRLALELQAGAREFAGRKVLTLAGLILEATAEVAPEDREARRG